MHRHIRTLDIKDFQWTSKSAKYQIEDVALGEGMVNFKQFFKLLQNYQINGPISLHYEYPLGGAESGTKSLSMPREKVLKAMKKDLVLLRKWLIDADLH
jgi:L-ribulose-5-phosphate 3-epimerase UlaE